MQEKLLSRQESDLLVTIGKSSFFITRVSFICVTNTLLTFVLSKGMCPGCRLQYQKKKLMNFHEGLRLPSNFFFQKHLPNLES